MNEIIDSLKNVETWLKKAKRNHVFYPSTFKLDVFSKQSLGYTVTIQSIKGVQLPQKTSTYELKYAMTLFHTTHKFFGRTYTGMPIPLKSTNHIYSTDVPEYIFFYSSLPADQLELVVELVITEKDQNGAKIGPPFSIGWTRLPIKSSGTAISTELLSGTPRALLYPFAKVASKPNVKLEYKVGQITKVPPELKILLPQDCLCGPWDAVPGLVGNRLPGKAEALVEGSLDLIPTCQVYVNNCVIKVPSDLEQKIVKNVAQVYELQEEIVKVYEIRLKVACHNQWGLVNTAKLKNSIALSSDEDVLRCNGIPTIDNVFIHPSTALIFQLEYTLTLTRSEKDIETLHLIVGELITLLSCTTGNELDPLNLASPLNTDAENSITGNIFFSVPNKSPESEYILICEVSSRQGNVAVSTPNELLAAVADRKKLEVEHKKQLNELKEQEAELHSKQYSLPSKKNKEVTPRFDFKQRTEPPKIPQMPQAIVTLAKGQNPGTASAKKMFESSLGRAIPIADSVSLLEKGITNSLTFYNEDFEFADIEEDKRDSLKASTIFFEFLAFKSNSEYLPKRLAFAYKFFTFPESRTDSVSLKTVDGRIYALETFAPIKNWSNLCIRNFEGKALRVQHNFDPTSDKDIPPEKALEDFLRYLAGNVCKIWIFSADGLLPIGICVIRLADLLRKREPMRTVKKEYKVFSYNGEIIGSMQLVLQNVGRRSGTIKAAESEVSIIMPKPQRKGKTKIISKPLKLQDLAKVPQMSLRITGDSVYGKSDMLASEERRKAELVYQYKLRTNPSAVEPSHSEDIIKYRTISRTLTLGSLAGPGVEKIQLPPIFYTIGEPSFYPLVYTNPYDFDCLFKCYLYDPEARNELQLVTDPNEWKYYCKKGGFQEPPDWTLLMGKKGFILKAGEQVPLLFRVLALGPPTKTERGATITIENVGTQGTEQISEVKLVYKETYYNSCHQFLVPENRSVDLRILPEIHTSIMTRAEFIKCSNPNVELKIQGVSVGLTFVAPSSLEDTELYLTIYGDQYYYEVICIIYILVKPYICLDITEIAGKRITHYITLDSDRENSRKVLLYSSDENSVRLGEYFGKVVEMREDRLVPLNIGTYKIGESQAIIHAVDIETSKVYKRWLFRFKTDVPLPHQVYNIRANQSLNAFFEYTNSSALKKTYELYSSDPGLVKVLETTLVLAGKEKGQVPILVKGSEEDEKQVYVFVNELSSGKVDAILFNITS